MKQEAEKIGVRGMGPWKGFRDGRDLGTRVTGEQVWKASSWGAESLGDPEK